MTIIAVRDGVIATDSMMSTDNELIGYTDKLYIVPEIFGGGFIGATGSSNECDRLVSNFLNCGSVPDEERENADLVHLRKDGKLFSCFTRDFWWDMSPDKGEFAAFGSGSTLARGAMELGASAIEACQVACNRDLFCGGEISSGSVVPPVKRKYKKAKATKKDTTSKKAKTTKKDTTSKKAKTTKKDTTSKKAKTTKKGKKSKK